MTDFQRVGEAKQLTDRPGVWDTRLRDPESGDTFDVWLRRDENGNWREEGRRRPVRGTAHEAAVRGAGALVGSAAAVLPVPGAQIAQVMPEIGYHAADLIMRNAIEKEEAAGGKIDGWLDLLRAIGKHSNPAELGKAGANKLAETLGWIEPPPASAFPEDEDKWRNSEQLSPNSERLKDWLFASHRYENARNDVVDALGGDGSLVGKEPWEVNVVGSAELGGMFLPGGVGAALPKSLTRLAQDGVGKTIAKAGGGGALAGATGVGGGVTGGTALALLDDDYDKRTNEENLQNISIAGTVGSFVNPHALPLLYKTLKGGASVWDRITRGGGDWTGNLKQAPEVAAAAEKHLARPSKFYGVDAKQGEEFLQGQKHQQRVIRETVETSRRADETAISVKLDDLAPQQSPLPTAPTPTRPDKETVFTKLHTAVQKARGHVKESLRGEWRQLHEAAKQVGVKRGGKVRDGVRVGNGGDGEANKVIDQLLGYAGELNNRGAFAGARSSLLRALAGGSRQQVSADKLMEISSDINRELRRLERSGQSSPDIGEGRQLLGAIKGLIGHNSQQLGETFNKLSERYRVNYADVFTRPDAVKFASKHALTTNRIAPGQSPERWIGKNFFKEDGKINQEAVDTVRNMLIKPLAANHPDLTGAAMKTAAAPLDDALAEYMAARWGGNPKDFIGFLTRNAEVMDPGQYPGLLQTMMRRTDDMIGKALNAKTAASGVRGDAFKLTDLVGDAKTARTAVKAMRARYGDAGVNTLRWNMVQRIRTAEKPSEYFLNNREALQEVLGGERAQAAGELAMLLQHLKPLEGLLDAKKVGMRTGAFGKVAELVEEELNTSFRSVTSYIRGIMLRFVSPAVFTGTHAATAMSGRQFRKNVNILFSELGGRHGGEVAAAMRGRVDWNSPLYENMAQRIVRQMYYQSEDEAWHERDRYATHANRTTVRSPATTSPAKKYESVSEMLERMNRANQPTR